MFSKKGSILLHRILKAFLISPKIPKNIVAFFSPACLQTLSFFPQLSGPVWGKRMLSQPHHGAALWGIAVQFSL